MSPELWATLLGGILAAAGVLGGVFAERWFQRRGRIRCTSGELFVEAYNNSAHLHKGRLPVDSKAVEGLAFQVYAKYEVNVKLFNEKDARTGLRDITVRFVSPDGFLLVEDAPQVFEASNKNAQSTEPYTKVGHNDAAKPAAAEILNLPSREWVNLTVSGNLGGEDAQKLSDCHHSILIGYYPSGKAFVKDISNEVTTTRTRGMPLSLAILLVLREGVQRDLFRNRSRE